MAAGDVDVQATQPSSESCASFDGVDDKIRTDSFPDQNLTDNSFSFSGWIKVPADEINASYIEFGAGTVTSSKISRAASESLIAQIITQAGGTVSSGQVAATHNTWHHVVLTKSPTQIFLYVDGTASTAGDTSSTSDYRVSASFYVGENDSANVFAKFFSRNVRVYNKVLSPAEVTRLANDEDIRDGLILHWNLNGDATDSVAGNNGTVTGAVFINDAAGIDTAVTAQRVTTGATNTFLIADVMNGTQVITAGITEA